MHTSVSKGKGKGKEKCPCEDDIPPKLNADQSTQLNCLQELKVYLECNKHSKAGVKTFCWIESSSEDKSGGHCKMRYEHMTLWEKLMVSSSKIE